MASADGELEQQLMETGNKLLQHLSSVDELLPLLDQVESFLSRVEQSPPKSMHTALSPSMKALVDDEFLRHSDVDVKVAVASCISEITRITAPDAPYDDDKMKDVFQLIVSSFENLSDNSSRSYNKRATILETVAKVRSCVIMLDLECEGLIVEMFQHFLEAIRDYHPENVFSSMETIMTLVLEESEDISLELLAPILASVKRDNEEVLPIARKLGERVFENCAVKLKPCLTQAVKSLNFSLDDYSKVVASICEGTTVDAVEHNVDNAIGEQLVDESKLAKAPSDEAAQADESKLTTASSEETAQVAKESVTDEPCPEAVDPAEDKPSKSVMSNGITETGKEGTSVDPESLKKPEHDHLTTQSLNVKLTSKAHTDDSDAGKPVKSESKREQTAKRRGRKPNSLIISMEPLVSSLADSEKEAEKQPDRLRSRIKDVGNSPDEDPSVEAATLSENEKETAIQLSSPKASEIEAVTVASPSSPSGNLPDESHLKKAGWPKKKESLIQEDAPSVDVSMKTSEVICDSEEKPQRRSRKKALAGSTKQDKISAGVGTSKNEGGTTSDSKAKPLRQSGKKGDASDSKAKLQKQSGKKGDASDSEAKLKQSGKKGIASNNIEDKSSLKTKEDGKRRGRGRDTREKDLTKSSAKDDVKEVISSPKSTTKSTKDISAKDEGHLEETPKINLKRKHAPGKDKASETVEYWANLVGSKIKVWWPDDNMFYEGAVVSYDPLKMKHKVLYTDGDEENLILRSERWELVEGDSVLDGEHATEDPSLVASPEMHKKKKGKINSEPLAKQENIEVSPKQRGVVASSSKLKGTATKSDRKSKDDGKADKKSKDNISKSSVKSEDETGGKTKDHSRKVGKSVDDAPRAAGKSKDVGGGTPKTTTKSKQDTPKTVSKSKGRTPESGNKSNANGMGKVKSSLSKVKEMEEVKGKSPDSAKSTLKAQESEGKSGKKRRRVKS